MKQFKLTDISYFNLKLVVATIALHWLSLYDMDVLNTPVISEKILPPGFYLDQYFFFGLAGVLTLMFLFVYPPVALFDLFIAKLSTKFTKSISVSPADMKFKKGKHVENLIRLATYALMCLTPYLFIASFINAVVILPFTFFHMILMAITTFMHGLQMLAIYRILLPQFVKLTKAFCSNLILAIW
ncbi:hypothetical protein CO058_03835 [candidate division WWE3 bacterium CG_4_9_14_0_2_um_filter_35_11]|uniref:Uncharacterized protein n=1 Tax=candidate division WWE3 bacterium CG_4_9_14_0_2_um_filter_35_11 TaxID=1975077 RepID=A0A2M8EKZ1_UNCKA|nr:MAG: hypothetical protein CO058_03835 [candidate division WWE3 bacterium CG_4_9_14_0_2_um_filter_35_11]